MTETQFDYFFLLKVELWSEGWYKKKKLAKIKKLNQRILGPLCQSVKSMLWTTYDHIKFGKDVKGHSLIT